MLAEPRSDQSYVEPDRAIQEEPDLRERNHVIVYGPWPGVSLPEDLIGMYYLS